MVGLQAYLVQCPPTPVRAVRSGATGIPSRRSDHITDALASLRWLQVPERIICKIAVQTYRALCGDAPQYLWQFTSIADIPSRQNKACGILYPTIHSFLPALTYRTAYRPMSPQRHLWSVSEKD